MNYIQRFSAALAAREARLRKRAGPAPNAGSSTADGGEHPTDPDWLSKVETVARQLPPRGKTPPRATD